MTCRYPHGAAAVGRVTLCAPLLVGSDGVQRTARPTNEEIPYRGYLLTRAANIGIAIRSGWLDRDCPHLHGRRTQSVGQRFRSRIH